jgi:hypothetical protein
MNPDGAVRVTKTTPDRNAARSDQELIHNKSPALRRSKVKSVAALQYFDAMPSL